MSVGPAFEGKAAPQLRRLAAGFTPVPPHTQPFLVLLSGTSVRWTSRRVLAPHGQDRRGPRSQRIPAARPWSPAGFGPGIRHLHVAPARRGPCAGGYTGNAGGPRHPAAETGADSPRRAGPGRCYPMKRQLVL